MDIILRDYNSGIYDLKTITNVTYSNAEFICTSSISKYDIPATGINADDVNDSDYEILYNELFPNSLTRKEFSHGYLTENSIVLITNNKTQIFEEVYLSQLSTISAYPQFIKSNKEGTKYIIEYTGNGYPQTIYIYKDGDNSNDETIESDTNSSDDCTITFTVSTENQFIENNRLPLLMESGDWTLEATICIPSGNQYLNGQITLNENKEITFNSAELNMILSYDDFLVTMFSESELESMTIDQKISKCNQIVKMVSSSMPEGVTIKVTEDGVRMGQVYSDESELKQLYLELGLQTINSETEIMTNSSNTRYIITLTKLINPDENSQSTESEPYTRITTIYLSKN